MKSLTLIDIQQKEVRGTEEKLHQNGAGASQLWYPCRRFEQLGGIARNKKGERRAVPTPTVGQFGK
jgi:hypothetical protein